jgi:hypothetical protein
MRALLSRRVVIVVAVGVVVAVWRWSPLWPGPGLPPHATRLHIETQPLHLIPALGCPTAALGPVRVATSGDDLIVVSPETDHPIRVDWPAGWAAWRLGGRGELVDRGGGVIGREGDVIGPFGGGMDIADEAFVVCEIGW